MAKLEGVKQAVLDAYPWVEVLEGMEIKVLRIASDGSPLRPWDAGRSPLRPWDAAPAFASKRVRPVPGMLWIPGVAFAFMRKFAG